jgi:outer membrane biogenesis lipoprotein LolB
MRKAALLLAVLLAACFATTADAAKKKNAKMSYEAAWAKCQPEVQSIPFWQESQRMQRAGACMRKLGHRL